MKSVFQLAIVVSVLYVLPVPKASANAKYSVSSYQPIFDSGKPKLVKLRLRNDVGTSVDLRLGDRSVSLQPGQTIDVRLPVGTPVTTTTAIPGHPAGEVLVVVDTFLGDALIHIKP